jgi:DNA-binding transcriptional MerR regulator
MRVELMPPTIWGMSGDGVDVEMTAGPSLTVGVLARRLGLAPATLRTWDRRYGIGPTGHAAGSHRRYTPGDVQRLQVMRRLTREGVLPAEAARIALAGSTAAVRDDPPDVVGTPGPVPLPDTGAALRGLVRAAQALDASAIDRMLKRALHAHGVLWTWDCLLVPALVAVGDKWGATGSGVDVEHLLTDCVVRNLAGATPEVADPRNARPVLLACAPEELHCLPLHALDAALAERGIDGRVLGARVPSDALAAAVDRAGASAVFIWASDPALTSADLLAAVPATRPPVTVVVGGPGWAGEVPHPAIQVKQLSAAVTTLQRAAVG